MSAHTPGPWIVESDGSTVSMGDQVVIVGPAPDGASRAEERANASLIAAAPDLLVRLKARVEACGCCGDVDFAVDVACVECQADMVVIARTEGR